MTEAETSRAIPPPPLPKRVALTILAAHYALICYFAVLWLFPSETPRVKGRARVEARLAELEAEGYSVTYERLAADYPELADGNNAAIGITNALRGLGDRTELRRQYSELPFIGEFEFNNTPATFTTEQIQEMEAFFGAHGDALKETRKALDKGRAQFLSIRDTHFSTPLHHLPLLRTASSMLALRAVHLASTESGSGESIDCIADIFRLASLLEPEPLGYSQIVRGSCQNDAFVAIWFLLEVRKVGADDLGKLRELIAACHKSEPWRKALEFEIYSVTDLLMRRHDELLEASLVFHLPISERLNPANAGADSDPAWTRKMKLAAIQDLARSGRLAEDALLFISYAREYLGLMGKPFPERLRNTSLLITRIKQKRKDSDASLFPSIHPGIVLAAIPGVVRKEAEIVTNQRCLLTAIAIELYRSRNLGDIPRELNDLVPDYLPEVPFNPYEEEAVNYRRSRDRYTLSCVGGAGPSGKPAFPFRR